MICRSCLRAATRTRIPAAQHAQHAPRFLSSSAVHAAAQPAPRQDNPTAHTPPAAPPASTSTPVTHVAGKDAGAERKVPLVRSSVPAGTPLKGLNFLKNAGDPVALADDEYPEWLWRVLEKQEQKAEAGAGDLFSKSKKQRRLAAKRLRKEQLANPELLAPKVHVTEQTIDLPAGDGTLQGAVQAAEARGELTKALRNKRRANIKEKNFLKAMG